ncbi:MAG: MgtC/SapB family protein [candidate division KSB1 bacterium]|nr:MgtC/SapB family protein [candidate division KSB1 bacterium]MDZ7340057.1 MgtC/SapB family protein [candidate division KSB1 bacterium]
MSILTADILKLLLSILIGGLIGTEREFRDKAAGFRTIIFICAGATLFTILSEKLGGQADAARISANIVTGIGFLGAGAILRSGGRIVGLTTASTIWLTAAIGMAIGAGHFGLALVMTGLMLIVLWFFPHIEEWIDKIHDVRSYEINCATGVDKIEHFKTIFNQHHLRVKMSKHCKIENNLMVCTFLITGAPKNHEQAISALMADENVRSFNF